MITNRFGYLVGLDFLRHLVDTGKLYFYSARHATGTAPIIYRIKTGSAVAHVTFNLSAGAAATFDIIENVTITGEGTSVNIRNYNRRKADNDTVTKIFIAPTYTGGTTFRTGQVGFGTNPGQAISGGISGEIDYQLKPNTEYIATHTPLTSVVTTLVIDLFETTI